MTTSCYLSTDGGELPLGRLDVEVNGGLGGHYGHDLLDVDADGTFDVLSLYDARICHGSLEPLERREWRTIVRELQQAWVRPAPAIVVLDGGSRCASLSPGGLSTGCDEDGGVRRLAAEFAHELRARMDDSECEPMGEPYLNTSWSAYPLGDPESELVGLIEVEWRDGMARSRPIDNYDAWTACAAPTIAQRTRLERLARAARDAMVFPGADRGSLSRRPPESAWFEWSQMYLMSVSVDSPYGRRGNRLLGVDPDLYRDVALAIAEVCSFAIDERRP